MTSARPHGRAPSTPLTSSTSRRRVLGLAGALAGAAVAAPAAALLGSSSTAAAAPAAAAAEPVDQEFECLADLIEAGEVSRADLLAG